MDQRKTERWGREGGQVEDRGTEREVRQSQTTLSQVAHFSFSSRPRQGPSPELSRAWLDSSALVQVGRCPASPSPPEAPPCRRRRGHQVAPSSTGQGPARVLAWAVRWTLAPRPLPLAPCPFPFAGPPGKSPARGVRGLRLRPQGAQGSAAGADRLTHAPQPQAQPQRHL